MKPVLLLMATFIVVGCEGVIVVEDDEPFDTDCIRFTRSDYSLTEQNLIVLGGLH